MRLLLLVLALCALAEGISVKLEPHASKCFWTDKLEKGDASLLAALAINKADSAQVAENFL